jgi:hypothetical protein
MKHIKLLTVLNREQMLSRPERGYPKMCEEVVAEYLNTVRKILVQQFLKTLLSSELKALK